MFTMEFNDIQKIWNEQRSESLYVIDEKALKNSIQRKKKKSEKQHLVSTIGLNLISLICGSFLIFKDPGDLFNLLTAAALIGIGLYVLSRYLRRKKDLMKYDHSMVGELNYAIDNTKREIKYSQTFWMWYLAPLFIIQVSEMIVKSVNWETILLLTGAYMLSLFVVSLSIRKQLKPRLHHYEKLKESLLSQD